MEGNLADQKGKNWRAIRGQRPLNEGRVASYRRLMEAELRLAEVRRRRGSARRRSPKRSASASRTSPTSGRRTTSVSRRLRATSAAVGGYFEVLAVFPGETVVAA
jgi:hypothetical protein